MKLTSSFGHLNVNNSTVQLYSYVTCLTLETHGYGIQRMK